MTTKWAHLPNAAHIDRIFELLASHPTQWETTPVVRVDLGIPVAVSVLAHVAARDMATATATATERISIYNIALDIFHDCIKFPLFAEGAVDAIVALIVYDDSAHLFESTAEEIKLLIALGHPYAGLMFQAVMTIQQIDNDI